MGTALLITGLVLGAIDAVATGLYNGITGKKIKKQVAELRNLVAKDSELKVKLENAYYNKNASLVNNIINSVPGGLANKVAVLEKTVKEQVHGDNLSSLNKSISHNQNSADKLEGISMTTNNMVNAANQSQYDEWKREGSVKPYHVDINKGEFEYVDLYGNKKKGNKESLNKWVYGQDKAVTNIKAYKQQPTSNHIIRKD